MSDTSRILVIDDEKNYLMVMEALLTDAGYEVTALNDPEMALHFLEESEVDVVITDMKMPKLGRLYRATNLYRPAVRILI